MRRTFRSITGLVIFCKPFQVLVFDPWHPRLVFLVVVFACRLLVCLLRLRVFVRVVRHLLCVGVGKVVEILARADLLYTSRRLNSYERVSRSRAYETM